MTSPRARGYAVLGAILVVVALGARRPEPLALAAPPLLLLAAAYGRARAGPLRAGARVSADRLLVGGTIELELTLAAPGAAEVEVRPELPAGLRAEARAARLVRGGRRTETLSLTARRWGVQSIPRVELVAHDQAGLLRWSGTVPVELKLRVYPEPDEVRRLLRPLLTKPAAGSILSAARGDGIEFADLRAFQPGDVVRRVNWRASARHGELVVNLQHPERGADVVLFLDSYADLGTGGESSLAVAVRAAAAVAAAHLRRRDRVGLIDFGGVLRWLQPGSGPRQAYRLLDALIDSAVTMSYAWRGLGHVPPRTLPPGAQVLALSPLADERAVEALLDLARRGRDLAVIELPVRRFAPPPATQADELAGRLFDLRAELLRSQLRELGVAVSVWDPEQPVEAALAELDHFRRRARRRRLA